MEGDCLEMHFPTRLIGRQVRYHAQLDSTSNAILQYADDPGNEGLVILADEQTRGRGTRSRHWFCPPGSGLLFSVLLFPPPELRRPVLLTTLAAVSVCEAIFAQIKRQASIKWPNDVLLQDRKVCGILIESHQAATVLGIGVNVDISDAEFRERSLTHAGSLAHFAAVPPHRMDLFRTLLTRLDDYYAELRAGQLQDLESRWRWHSGLLGRQVVVQTGEETILGRLLEMSFAGIEVQTGAGQVLQFTPEELDRISLVQ
jgi:BirA family transcriptional regulator, biotin operon repressor / biotin---[acetyl-CoA-carboxylase] ligase